MQLTAVGYGIASDTDVPSRQPLFAALDRSSKELWRLVDVGQAGCSVEVCEGYTVCNVKLNATGETAVERVVVHEEIGMAAGDNSDSSDRAGGVERVRTTPPRSVGGPWFMPCASRPSVAARWTV